MADIKILAPFILSYEGGFVNHPADPGGATNRGVTIATWKQVGYDKNGDGKIDVTDLKMITADDAVNRVMKPHYWDRWKADQIKSQSLANILVDWVWASGANGIKPVQKLLGVSADGIVGSKTLAALNAQNPNVLFDKIKRARESFLRGVVATAPSKGVFLKGWLRRLDAIGYGSLLYNTDKPGSPHVFVP